MRVGDRYDARSIIGSTFGCAIVAETDVAGRPAIIPTVSGRAWITGTHQLMLDPTDPYPGGYRLSDTWPGGGGNLAGTTAVPRELGFHAGRVRDGPDFDVPLPDGLQRAFDGEDL